MAKLILLDTHVAVWLYSGDLSLLSDQAMHLIETTEVRVSPMVLLELGYLKEIKKITVAPEAIMTALHKEVGLEIDETPFTKIIQGALTINWTRDPFDRIITATAVIHKAKLLTKDRLILKNCPYAVWDG